MKFKNFTMKKITYLAASLLIVLGMAACSNAPESSNGVDSTGNTTTTTTTVTRHYSGSFQPKPEVKYIDLKTRQYVTVRIDTIRGEVVNSETNEPINLFVEPETHDTIYGLTGNIVNNNLIHDASGDFRVDTVKMSSPDTTTPTTVTTTTTVEAEGNYKEKVKANKSKLKTDDVKVKEKNGVIKVKER